MNRVKVSDDFYADEFFYPSIYHRLHKKWGEERVSWWINPQRIQRLQLLRDLVGVPVTNCNWATGGPFKYSGLRPMTSLVGAIDSQHKYNNADDPKVWGMDSEQVHNIIHENWDAFRKIGVTTLEHPDKTRGKGLGWTHMDGRFVSPGEWDINVRGPYIV